ncbi:TetR/AcrR family transcriptional regulator [Lactobacillus sp. LC28-10]|uniref:TetR/AcrR family transcriptional regulator n=1 Tax=Secundilactobacillus angelensis TaxID=2722706 RepID=A0ABX1KYX1_9LACO|nr:TetR/AcrR family transcriptional regulator [Secundilactobacillus angelensis]MCH5462659.1 TetR/AcrR family transcriptional regulator [Secundilactobacillus angelensis]NLR19151.1 TetR/AcrR family transcriptional regulator [Secundilactobacillus angelensis]
MKKKISASYRDWLNEQEMPKGKRSAMLSALELFSKQGYDGTSTMAIAKNAGISQATIFKYFKTKDDLLRAILKPMINHLLPEYREDFLSNIPEATTLRQAVHFLLTDRYAFLKKNKEVALIFLTQVLTNADTRNMFRTFMGETAPMFIDYIYGTLKKTGQLRDDLTPAAVLRTIAGQVLSYFIQREVLLPDVTADEDADLQLAEDLIVRALSTD